MWFLLLLVGLVSIVFLVILVLLVLLVFLNITLFLIIDAAHSGGNRGEYLVGDGVGGAGYLLQEVGIAKDGHFVAFLTGDIGDIEETHIHANAADDGHLMVADGDSPVAIA